MPLSGWYLFSAVVMLRLCLELYAKGQLRHFTADSTLTLSFAFNGTFREASNMYTKAKPEQAKMCALYAAFEDGLQRATSSEYWGGHMPEKSRCWTSSVRLTVAVISQRSALPWRNLWPPSATLFCTSNFVAWNPSCVDACALGRHR